MTVSSRSSVLLSTLALVSAGLMPTMAVGQVGVSESLPASSAPQACQINGASTTIDVDGTTKTLAKGVEEATALLANCADGGLRVDLRLTGEGPYQFPEEVNAKGIIRVTSGLADEKYPRIEQQGEDPVVLLSAIEMDHIHWVGNHKGFVAQDSFTLTNSKIEYGGQGKVGDKSRHFVIADRSDPQANSGKAASVLTFTNNTFTNMGIVFANEVTRLDVRQNTVSLTNERFAAVGIIGKGTGNTHSEISNNTFTAVNHTFVTVLGINDNHVTVKENTFDVVFAPGIPAGTPYASVLLVNEGPLPNGFSDIAIKQNTFKGGPAVDWAEDIKAPPTKAGAIIVERNNLSQASGAFASTNTPVRKAALNASCNYWGNLDRSKAHASGVEEVLKSAELAAAECVHLELPKPPAPVPVPPAPLPSPSPSEDVVFPREIREDAGQEVAIDKSGLRLAGLTRFETAVEAAQHRFPREGGRVDQSVIVARGDVAADSVAAVPLAKALDAPILLTPSQEAHPSMVEEIRRLVKGRGEVILMGGESAISSGVERTVAGLGVSVSRIQGANRADTAVQTAKKLEALGKLESVFLVDGQDWQPALITGPVAAKTTGVTLLTNGEVLAPETKAFLAEHQKVGVTAIGTNAASTGVTEKRVEGRDGTELSLKVAREFFGGTDRIGVATSVDFADALIGGGHIGQEGGALVLTNGRNATRVNAFLKTQPSVSTLYVYGGKERIGVASEQSR